MTPGEVRELADFHDREAAHIERHIGDDTDRLFAQRHRATAAILRDVANTGVLRKWRELESARVAAESALAASQRRVEELERQRGVLIDRLADVEGAADVLIIRVDTAMKGGLGITEDDRRFIGFQLCGILVEPALVDIVAEHEALATPRAEEKP